MSPDRVTLVPGNHDLYSSQAAFSDALTGPLRPYARTSRIGRALDFGDVVILPTATTKPQPLPLSAGTLRPAQARSVAALASDCQRRGRTLILAQHHPPLGYRNRIWNWIDGMDRVRCFFELLLVHESLTGRTRPHPRARELPRSAPAELHRSMRALRSSRTRSMCDSITPATTTSRRCRPLLRRIASVEEHVARASALPGAPRRLRRAARRARPSQGAQALADRVPGATVTWLGGVGAVPVRWPGSASRARFRAR